jgi:ADP-ribose pyrophosphatase
MIGDVPVPESRVESITTLSSREVYRNPWLSMREDQILRSNGNAGIYSVVDKEDCAIIIPLEADAAGDRVWLVEQFRYTVQERCLELPQGGWEMGDVVPEELARGELREELGLNAEEMIYLGTVWIAYGFTRQKQHVFVAMGLTHTEKEPDPEEHDLVAHSVPVAEFERWMLDGTIQDCCTLSAWGLYLLWKSRRKHSSSPAAVQTQP